MNVDQVTIISTHFKSKNYLTLGEDGELRTVLCELYPNIEEVLNMEKLVGMKMELNESALRIDGLIDGFEVVGHRLKNDFVGEYF